MTEREVFMLISVIIPVYNGANYIERCVRSFLMQTHSEIELILYDDASTDNTWQVLQQLTTQYPETIRVYHGSYNKGPGGGKSAGLKCAKGEYVYFADCDDYVSATHLERLLDAAKFYQYPDIVIGSISSVDMSGKKHGGKTYKDANSALYQNFSDCGKLFSLQYLRKNQLYMPSGHVLEDILFQTANILCHPVVATCDDAGYYYIQNAQSITHTVYNTFKPGVMELEFQYLEELKQKCTFEEDRELLTYYAFRCVCWHLLKSGANVGKEAMAKEYARAVELMEHHFPGFQRCRSISWFRPKYERRILRFVVGTVKLLYRLGLSKWFFLLYAQVDLSRFWPSM